MLPMQRCAACVTDAVVGLFQDGSSSTGEEKRLYKHLLLPTDGSLLSEVAVRHCMQFARDAGAKVTGFYAMPEFQVLTYKAEMLEDTREEFEKHARAQAEKILSFVKESAQAQGVACDTTTSTADHPWAAIIQTAREHGCDLIFMASHGRGGLAGLLLGSETQKVLTHSKIPVLVHR